MGTKFPPDHPMRALLELLRINGSTFRLDLTVCTFSYLSIICCIPAHHSDTSKRKWSQAGILQRMLFHSAFDWYHEYGGRHRAVSVSLKEFHSTKSVNSRLFKSVRHARILWQGSIQILRIHLRVVWRFAHASHPFRGLCPLSKHTDYAPLLNVIVILQNLVSSRLSSNSQRSADKPHRKICQGP